MFPDTLAFYEKIQAFSLDAIDAAYPLSRRLARENRWSITYTQRTIEEYKKFILLAMIAGHPVTPSEQVDQVWHLHLIYSHSYWEEFCPKVLGQSLHHGPTQGGTQETEKYRDWYRKTLEAYERTFGYAAPSDIWPTSDRRFGLDIQVERVNVQQNWVIPKPDFPRFSLPTIDRSSWDGSNFLPKIERYLRELMGAGMTLALTFGTSGCAVINPLEVKGPEFLGLYFKLAILVLTVGYIWRWWGWTGQDSSTADQTLKPYELAYLNGGKNRVVELAVTSLVKSKVIEIEAGKPWAVVSPQPDVKFDPIERQILNLIESGMQLSELRQQNCSEIEDLRSHLQQHGLALSDATAKRIKWINWLLMGGLFGLGIIRLVLGMANGRPVGFLITIIIIFALLSIGLWITPQRTRKGDLIVHSTKVRYAYITPNNVASLDLEPQVFLLAFAIYGSTLLLGDPALATLGNIIMPPTTSSSGGDGGCSSFSGGGGCSSGCSGCGGGCGGCGGCGG